METGVIAGLTNSQKWQEKNAITTIKCTRYAVIQPSILQQVSRTGDGGLEERAD
jgi:hypothetical protein